MRITGKGKETYLFLNGIEVSRAVRIGNAVELLPATCSPDPNTIVEISESEVALGVTAIFLRQVRGQLRIREEDPKKLAALAWNSVWDAVLLSALYDCDAVCNFQSDQPAEKFGYDSNLEITNYHLRGLSDSPYRLSEEDSIWIEENFEKARDLLAVPEFQNAVHCLATYRWHSHPRARLALIWSGIEGLFKIKSEIVFRLSLYIAKFLEPNRDAEGRAIFDNVRKLYKQRSAAVHGSKIKGAVGESVAASVPLLSRLLYECINRGAIPCTEELAP